MKETELSGHKSKTFFQKYWHLMALALIVLLSFFLYFYSISNIGYGNAYYAAAIKSMTESLRNFFYVSFDPAGVVSVDKPPLGLWVQVLFVNIFGYQGWAMLLPQALAGVGSTIMMYVLTSKYFGRTAGLLSALVFAVTPAAVVASRNNTMDMQLIFILLAAAWFLFKAIEKSKWRYIFICAALIGVGFNIKMLQAFMVLPAVVIVYLLFSKEKGSKRIIAVVLSGLILAGVSFAWVAAVDLTPAGQRPFIGSSTDNREMELVVGHNGLERLFGTHSLLSLNNGNAGQGPGGNPNSFRNRQNPNGNPLLQFPQAQGPAPNNQNMNPSKALQWRIFGGNPMPGQGVQGAARIPGSTGGFGAGGNDIGVSSILRLWQGSVYGQASWLIILALFCITAKVDFKKPGLKKGTFIFWVCWLAAMYGFFSFADFWHRYYLCMVAPGVAGLVGPGLVQMIRDFREKKGWRQYLLPASLAATLIVEAVYVWNYITLRIWLEPLMIAAGAAALWLMFWYSKPVRIRLMTAVGFMLLALLAAPFYWSLTVVMYPPQNSTMPYAGPELASKDRVPGMTPNQETLTTGDAGTIALEKYLVAHYKQGSYLIVSESAADVAQYIVDTGLPAVAYGGFLGTDKVMTLDQFKQLVAEGKITYFWIPGGISSSELDRYVQKNAKHVNPSEYQTEQNQKVGQTGGMLYEFK